MHTKISPADDYEKWIKRGIASHQSMVAVEELRVNYGLKLQGFDVAELLDGNEDADGEYVAIHNQWDSAVIFAVATAGTGGAKRFLVGVRRHNKLWADSLATIQKRFLKEIKKDTSRASNGVYSTRVENESGLAPRGFQWTERMAEYLDRLCKNEPKPIEAKTAKKDTEGEADEEGDVVSSVGPQSESSTPEEEVEDMYPANVVWALVMKKR
jgi:hypothetical protein